MQVKNEGENREGMVESCKIMSYVICYLFHFFKIYLQNVW